MGKDITARLGLDISPFKAELINAQRENRRVQDQMAKDASKKKGGAGSSPGNALFGSASGIAGAVAAGGGASAVQGLLDFAGNLQDTSDGLNMNVESLQELRGAFSQSGTTAKAFDKGMGELNINLGKARDGNEDVIATFANLGVSIADIQNLAPDQILMEMADGFQTSADRGQALKDVNDLLGKSGKTMAAGLSQGSEAIAELRGQISKLTTEEVAALDAAGDKLDQYAGKVKIAAATVLEAIISPGKSASLKGINNRIGAMFGFRDEVASVGPATPQDLADQKARADKGKITPESEQQQKKVAEAAAKANEEREKAWERYRDAVVKAHNEELDDEARLQSMYAQRDALLKTANLTTAQGLADKTKALEIDREAQKLSEKMGDDAMNRGEKRGKAAGDKADKDKKDRDEAAKKLAEKQKEQAKDLREAKGESGAIALELRGKKELADALRTELEFREKIRKAKEDGNTALATELQNQQKLSTQNAVAQQAYNKRESQKLSLSEIADTGTGRDAARARQAMRLEERARRRIANFGPDDKQAQKELSRAKELRRGIRGLKDSEKEMTSALQNALDASKVLDQIEKNTKGGWANK